MPTVRAASRNAGSGDTGGGGGYFVLNAAAQSIHQEIEISVLQLEQLSYQSSSGADTLWVHANDGTQTVQNATGRAHEGIPGASCGNVPIGARPSAR
jgi:hypothetical protein